MYVRKPIRGANGWVVIIAERIECSSREEAWKTYRYIQRERGVGL